MEPRWWHHASHHQIERRDIFWNKAPADGVSGWAGAAVLRPFGEQFNIRLPVNVVQVSFTKTASLSVRVQGNPWQRGGPGTTQIEASDQQGADPQDLKPKRSNVAVYLDGNGDGSFDQEGNSDNLVVDLNGPVVNAGQRGVEFIRLAFVQQGEVVAKHGNYTVNGQNRKLVAATEDGQTHWDISSNPWPTGVSKYYFALTNRKPQPNGLQGLNLLSWDDDPIINGTDPTRFRLDGSQVQGFSIDFAVHVYFVTGTLDPGVLKGDSDQTIRLQDGFTFIGDGPVDSKGIWKKGNTAGVTLANNQFQPVIDGSTVGSAEPDVNSIWPKEEWKLK